MSFKLSLFIIGFSAILFSCSVQDEINVFEEIPNQKWEYSFAPKANISVLDKQKSFEIYLNFKHNHVYPYSNLFYILELKKDKMLISSERFELNLAEPDGKWTGKGSGSQYTHEQLIKGNFQFPDTGVYTLEVTQNMRENPLNGVVAAGIRITENKN